MGIRRMSRQSDDILCAAVCALNVLEEVNVNKREDYISWEEFFMGVAQLSSRRSKDPNTQVGACIVNSEHIILSTGYNGMPCGCDDNSMPWGRESDLEESTKYPYVVHAELNAILNADGRLLTGSTIYVTCFPCNECAKAIIQAGIKKVIFLEDKYPELVSTKVAKKLFKMVGIKTEKFSSLALGWDELLDDLRSNYYSDIGLDLIKIT